MSSGVGGADHLVVDGVSKSFPDRRVLTDISLTVSSGDRACLIGENGTGKTTLLRIIAGLDDDHAGHITAPGTIGLFHQQPPFDLGLTVDRVLAEATAPVRAVAEEVTRLAEALADGPASAELAIAYDRALAETVRTDAWDVDQQVDRLVDGLDLARIPRDRRASSLSGGQVSRLSLAWLLLRRPDTLLLDEPTNHLDARGTALLVDLLAGWSGPVLIASHDRAFLDDTATTLLDLDPAPRLHADVQRSGIGADGDGPGSGFGITRFGGSYTAYLLHRIEERERWERRYREEQAELKRLRQQVKVNHTVGNADRGPRTEARASKKFYSDRNAKVVSRRVNDAATALERLEDTQIRKPPAILRFGGLAAAAGGPSVQRSRHRADGDHRGTATVRGGGRPTSGSGPVLVATEVACADRLAPVSLTLGARSRLLITGSNGAGKSTLLAILAGRLEPDAGSVTTSGRLTVGLLGQDADHLPDADLTVADAYRSAVGEALSDRVPLGTFGLIAGRDEQRRVRELSVGQRRRLDLAVLLASPPDVLLLDEPTNHFSLLLSTRLEASIPEYPGAVVVASHDRWLRAGWKGETLDIAPEINARHTAR